MRFNKVIDKKILKIQTIFNNKKKKALDSINALTTKKIRKAKEYDGGFAPISDPWTATINVYVTPTVPDIVYLDELSQMDSTAILAVFK